MVSVVVNGSAPRHRGFTMIELLVVVGIIAVLLAIILPTLAAARTASTTTICASNLRELGKDMQQYLNANNGQPMIYDGYQTYWVDQLRPYGNIDKTRFCPVATTRTGYGTALDGSTRQTYFGSATAAWNNSLSPAPVGAFNSDTFTPNSGVGSYGMNWFIYNINSSVYGPHAYPANSPIGGSHPSWEWLSPISASPAASVPLFGDCNWVDSGPDCSYTLASDGPSSQSEMSMHPAAGPLLYWYNGCYSTAAGINRFCLARHGRSMNMVFIDGHVQKVPLELLLTLYWHPGYANTTTLLTVPY
jgi:prepilin-type N-terminal cleavage/methylation domain-containing protein/prepilin-type processing-associated H-X9-DG protein